MRNVMLALILLTMPVAADAGEPKAQAFIPLTSQYRSMTPHFFALPARKAAVPVIHSASAAALPKDDDIPMPKGHPEAMTQEQAQQILSLFGASE